MSIIKIFCENNSYVVRSMKNDGKLNVILNRFANIFLI